jgi:hypothetical protein
MELFPSKIVIFSNVQNISGSCTRRQLHLKEPGKLNQLSEYHNDKSIHQNTLNVWTSIAEQAWTVKAVVDVLKDEYLITLYFLLGDIN